jgi:hypothetical protein
MMFELAQKKKDKNKFKYKIKRYVIKQTNKQKQGKLQLCQFETRGWAEEWNKI